MPEIDACEKVYVEKEFKLLFKVHFNLIDYRQLQEQNVLFIESSITLVVPISFS